MGNQGNGHWWVNYTVAFTNLKAVTKCQIFFRNLDQIFYISALRPGYGFCQNFGEMITIRY